MPATCVPGTDDAALVRRTQAGDEVAFEAIFKRHHAPLLSYCRHMLGNQADGEDALQQAFIKAHQALLGGKRATRAAPMAVRDRTQLLPVGDHGPTAHHVSGGSHSRAGGAVGGGARSARTCASCSRRITRLPEDQRSALLLAELDDLDHQAIATIVGCRVSKVKALIYQARSSLIAERDAQRRPARRSANSSRWRTAANFVADRYAAT